MEDRFGEVLIPTETVTERAPAERPARQKTSFPGYIFVEMEMSEEVWHLVKDTPKVTGFIGNQRPQEVNPAADRRSPEEHRRGRGQAEAARLVRGGRRDPRHRRRVRELLGHGRRGEAGQAEATRQGVDLRRATPVELDFAQVEKLDFIALTTTPSSRGPRRSRGSSAMKKVSGQSSSCSSRPARPARRRRSARRSARTASTSWRSARSSTPRRRQRHDHPGRAHGLLRPQLQHSS
jgi:transcriptional antiterminator NusG